MKDNMKTKFQSPIINLYKALQIFVLIIIVLGIISNYYNKKTIGGVVKAVSGIHIGYCPSYIVSRIKYDVRVTSIALVVNEKGIVDEYMEDLNSNLNFLENVYIQVLYSRHTPVDSELYTIEPIDNDVIDQVHYENYFKNILRLDKKARLYLDKFNVTGNDFETLDRPEIRYFKTNELNRFGPLFMNGIDLVVADNKNSISKQLTFIYITIGLIAAFELFIIFFVIIPFSKKCVETIKNIFSIFKDMSKEYLDDLINEYDDKFNQLINNYEIENLNSIIDNEDSTKHKENSTKALKWKFIIFSILAGIFVFSPFLTIYIFKDECMNTVEYLANSTKRMYYANTLGNFAFETLFQDNATMGKKIRAYLTEMAEKLQDIDSKLKSGYYGITLQDLDVYKPYLDKPGCLRPNRYAYQCDKRKYDSEYSEELANSSLKYIMAEYINRVNEFVNNVKPEKDDDGLDPITAIHILINEAMNNSFLHFHNKVIHDIAGHTIRYTEIGSAYLSKNVSKYLKIDYILHISFSLMTTILFLTYITKKIKEQLYLMEVLTNIIFSIPIKAYEGSSRLKNFIETGNVYNS